MHTESEIKNFQKMLNLFGKLGLARFRYNPVTGCVESKKQSPIRKCINILVCCLHMINAAFLAIGMKTATTQTKAMLTFNFLTLVVETPVRMSFQIFDSETVLLINSIIQIDKIFGGNNVRKRKNTKFEIIRGRLYVVIFGCLFASILATTSHTYVLNYKNFSSTWMTFGLYTFCTCVGGLFFVNDFCSGPAIFILSAVTTNFWTKKCCLEWPKTSPLSYRRCISVYRPLKLLNDLHNIVFGSIFIPVTKLGVIFAVFVTAFGVIRLRDEFSTPVYVIFVLYLVTELTMLVPGAALMSHVYDITMNFQKNIWNNFNEIEQTEKEREEIRRILKSLPLLKCGIGSFYHMEKEAKLTLGDNLANGIAYCLVSF